jgi:hypothetical protein
MTALGQLVLEPLVPWWLLAALALIFAAGLALMALRARGVLWPRLLASTIILAVLANPTLREDVRAERPDIAVALLDRSASMRLEDRTRSVDEALAALRRAAPDVEWRVTEVRPEPGGRTRLGAAVDRVGVDVPADRLAGVVVLTDGVSADAPDPRAAPGGAPLHLLIAGDRDISDRRLVVERVPTYSVVGQPANVVIRIDDGEGGGGKAILTKEIAGTGASTQEVEVGRPVTLRIPVDRRGTVEVALSISPKPGGEATLVNNRALVRLNGVTDRLHVLLVSGVPYPGGRVWRDILKSDANIDLVHFTILRLPTSFDVTPPEQMSLIPFPVEELFEKHLGDFDLIIFDRFGLSELLSPIYFQDLADRVREGGGLLVVTGDEFEGPGGLARTPLARLLPVRVEGPVIDKTFRPVLTNIGERHPVTATLRQAWGNAPWGLWGAQSDLQATGGEVLMAGVDGKPLLVLQRVGEGRVGLLASTNVWWWARNVEGGGPRDELLRRTAHWLMREPDLDENQLDVTSKGRTLEIRAHGVSPSRTATVTGPGGARRTAALQSTGNGENSGEVTVAEDGLFRVEAGGRTRFALAGDTAELSEIRPRETPLATAARASGGGTFWLHGGDMPNVRRVDADEAKSGPSWLGLVRNRSGAIVAVRRRPVLPPALALALVAGSLLFAWWRERT